MLEDNGVRGVLQVFIQPHAVPALPQSWPASPCEPQSVLAEGHRLIRQEIVGIVDQRAWTKAERKEAKARRQLVALAKDWAQ